MLKKIIFLGLIIFSNVKPAEDDYMKANTYITEFKYSLAVPLLKRMSSKHDYYDRVYALLNLAEIYSGTLLAEDIDYHVRPNKKKAISYLDIILSDSGYSSITKREAQAFKDEILNS